MKRIGAVRGHLVHLLAVLLAFLRDFLTVGRQMLIGLVPVLIHDGSPFTKANARAGGTAPFGPG